MTSHPTQLLLSALQHSLYDINPGTLLVACSGGSDSVGLAAAVRRLDLPMALAHVNYRLRGAESDEEEAFVRSLAEQWKVPCHVLQVPVETWTAGASLQAVARAIRYQFFEEIIETHRYTCCLTAHHLEDQAESLLLSWLRGNSPSLFLPIPAQRGHYLRPFLSLRKSTIQAALQAWNQPWREDSSNQKQDYLRNRVRHEVLPALRLVHPQAEDQVLKRADWYFQQLGFLRSLMEPLIQPGQRFAQGIHTFSWAELSPAHRDHLPVMIAQVLETWGWHGHDLWAGVALAQAPPGKIHAFGEGVLIQGRDLFQWIPQSLFAAGTQVLSQADLPWEASLCGRRIRVTQTLAPTSWGGEAHTHYLAETAIRYPLTLRPWQQQDAMQPLGMQGNKLLSDIMIDNRYRPAQKARAWVLEDAEGIVLLSDFRIAERVRVQPGSSVLRLEIEPAD